MSIWTVPIPYPHLFTADNDHISPQPAPFQETQSSHSPPFTPLEEAEVPGIRGVWEEI